MNSLKGMNLSEDFGLLEPFAITTPSKVRLNLPRPLSIAVSLTVDRSVVAPKPSVLLGICCLRFFMHALSEANELIESLPKEGKRDCTSSEDSLDVSDRGKGMVAESTNRTDSRSLVVDRVLCKKPLAAETSELFEERHVELVILWRSRATKCIYYVG
jgi:hypothetical protein